MVQLILAIITLTALAGVTFLIYRYRVNEVKEMSYEDKISMDTLCEIVMADMAEFTRDDGNVSTKGKSFEAEFKNRKLLSEALDNCVHGIKSARDIVIAQIRFILERELPNLEEVYQVLDFRDVGYQSPNIQWEILCYYISKKKGFRNHVMKYIVDKYKINEPRDIKDKSTGRIEKRRLFDTQMLLDIVDIEVPKEISYQDAIEILSLLVFQNTYGFRVVDTIRHMDIDGFNMGTSGSIRYKIDGNRNAEYTTLNSVWVQINAKWVHFKFLEFSCEDEMKRVINQLTSWGTSSPMTEKSPKKVNDGFDGARITAVRPPIGECWACFVRKFTPGLYSSEKLLNKPTVHNWKLADELTRYLMRSEQTLPFTGQQNTGKTSMMKAKMADLNPGFNIRVMEMSFELALRELYSKLNIITVKPSDYVSSAELQDLLKKTDGYVSMVGEVAENDVAARMIQFCLIASAFTIFSHHAKDDYSLINGLANSLVACGEYEDHNVAMSTVLDAIKHNVHMDFVNNERVIAYVSEIIKLDEVAPYPSFGLSDDIAEAIDKFRLLSKEFYTRSTDRVRFKSTKIMTFDKVDMTYKPTGLYTPNMLRDILKKLDNRDRKDFINFYKSNWSDLLNEEYRKSKLITKQ